jgi:hypothetical protein
VRPRTENVGFPSLDKDARLASGLSGVNVAGVQDGSWSCLWFVWHCLAAKSFHVEADVDELAYFLHHPTVYDQQMWVQCFLTRAALSRLVAVGGGAFLGGVKPLGLDIFRGVDRHGT